MHHDQNNISDNFGFRFYPKPSSVFPPRYLRLGTTGHYSLSISYNHKKYKKHQGLETTIPYLISISRLIIVKFKEAPDRSSPSTKDPLYPIAFLLLVIHHHRIE